MKTDENQTEKRKEAAKKAMFSGNFADALMIGFEHFLSLLSPSVSFEQFLSDSGTYFDGIIQRSCREDSLTYMGGKLILELLDASNVKMTADFYYQNAERQWVHNQHTATVKGTRWSDWKTNEALMNLRKDKKLEYPIHPPEKSGGA